MSLADFLKCVWCDHKKESEHTILYANKYEKSRAEAIQIKVESNLWINRTQVEIKEFYITNKGGITAWVRTDPKLVQEILKHAQKAQSSDFKTTIFVPKMARARKASINKLLLAFKEANPDFRYII